MRCTWRGPEFLERGLDLLWKLLHRIPAHLSFFLKLFHLVHDVHDRIFQCLRVFFPSMNIQVSAAYLLSFTIQMITTISNATDRIENPTISAIGSMGRLYNNTVFHIPVFCPSVYVCAFMILKHSMESSDQSLVLPGSNTRSRSFPLFYPSDWWQPWSLADGF